jgi:hypothetical protein
VEIEIDAQNRVISDAIGQASPQAKLEAQQQLQVLNAELDKLDQAARSGKITPGLGAKLDEPARLAASKGKDAAGPTRVGSSAPAKVEIPKNINPADLKFFDDGSFKDIYTLEGYDSILVAFFRDPNKEIAMSELTAEMNALNRLEDLGALVIKNYGITQVNGRPALLLERIPDPQSSKKIGDELGGFVTIYRNADLSRLNQKSINDLNNIKSVLEKNNISVKDLQFIISKDGSVRINDPLNVFDYIDKGNIELIDELIKRAKMNEIIG